MSVDQVTNLFGRFGSTFEIDEVLPTIDRKLREVVSYDSFSAWFMDKGAWAIAYASGEAPPNASALTTMLAHACESDDSAAQGKVLVLPMRQGNEPVGAIVLYRRDPLYSSEEASQPIAFAEELAPALIIA